MIFVIAASRTAERARRSGHYHCSGVCGGISFQSPPHLPGTITIQHILSHPRGNPAVR